MKEIIVGRNPDMNNVVIADRLVSGVHMKFIQSTKGEYFIEDLGSLNGTYINGFRVDKLTNVQINKRDIIKIGNTLLPWNNYFKDDYVLKEMNSNENVEDATTTQNYESNIKDDIGTLELDLVYAGFGPRLGAILLDGVFLTVINSVILLIFIKLNGYNIAFLQLIFIVVQWLYFAISESSSSQASFGKRILGLQVTRLNGNRISFGRATGRYLGKILSGIILFIGFLMPLFTEKKQALHDIISECVVIKN